MAVLFILGGVALIVALVAVFTRLFPGSDGHERPRGAGQAGGFGFGGGGGLGGGSGGCGGGGGGSC